MDGRCFKLMSSLLHKKVTDCHGYLLPAMLTLDQFINQLWFLLIRDVSLDKDVGPTLILRYTFYRKINQNTSIRRFSAGRKADLCVFQKIVGLKVAFVCQQLRVKLK